MQENEKTIEKLKNQKFDFYEKVKVNDINNLIPLNLMTAYDEQNLKVSGPKEIESFIVENVCTSFKTKFRCNFNPKDCKITLEFNQPIYVRGYGIRSADSEPEFDLKSWELLADVVNIHTGELIQSQS